MVSDAPRVLIFPADATACGHYRLTWPAEILQDNGWDIRIVYPNERGHMLQTAYHTDDNGENWPTEVFIPDCDVVVFQRVTNVMLTRTIPLIRAKGIAVVVDVDDDLSSIHPSNPAFTAMHPTHGNDKAHSWHNTLAACEAATLVQVSTPALVNRYGRKGNARVTRNCVPARYLSVKHEDSTIVGWGAGLFSHMNDVDALGSSIARLQREGVSYAHLGDVPKRVQRALKLDEPPIDFGIAELRDWPEQLTRLGIGLAPLADTMFNRAKSWLKPLEYAALGVPCVMSPRAEYRDIQHLGIGTLAKNAGQWYNKVKALVENDSLRQEMSEAGREAVQENGLTYEKQAWQWGEVWKEAALLR